MAVYDLDGFGVQALTSGTTRLFISVLTLPDDRSIGNAYPANYFKVGLLRLGIGGAYFHPEAVDADTMVMDLPDGVDSLGYSLLGDSIIQVTEYPSGGSPPGAFASDPMFSATTVALNGRTAALGGDWQGGASSMQVSTAGMFVSGGSGYTTSDLHATPAIPDYRVEADITVTVSGVGNGIGVIGRCDLDFHDWAYWWSYYPSAGVWRMFVNSATDFFVLLSEVPDTFTDGQTKHCVLDMHGSTIRGLVDGIAIATVTNTSIADAGFAGVWGENSGATDVFLTNFQASN